MLTTGQGIGAEAAEALLHAIDEGGPQGTREILASYERLLAPTLARAVRVQAADRMRTLLETLWRMRAEKGWEREAGNPSDAADPQGAAAAEGGGDAGVPDAARFSLSDIDLKVWPEAAPLVAYFKSLGPDAEGYFRSYRHNRIPYFQAFGDEAEWAILEIAGGGVYVAAPGMSGPTGWIQRSPVALHFPPEQAAKLTAPVTFWVSPSWTPWAPKPGADAGEANDEAGLWAGPSDEEQSWIRPRPLFHLSFGRPMTKRELARLVGLVPSLATQPDDVLREIAGLDGQARSVMGVDATTGEYVLAGCETPAEIADMLVGDPSRADELIAANPHLGPRDRRVRLPPRWFGYVSYAVRAADA